MPFMSQLLSFAFWRQLFRTFLDSCQRFPLGIVSLFILTTLIILDIHHSEILSRQQWQNSLLITIGGAFWFIASTLFSERRHWSKQQYYLLSLPVFALYSGFVIQQNTTTEASLLLIFSAGLSLSFSAYIFQKRSDNASVWYFNYQLISAIFFAILAAIIFCSGLSLILTSLEYLFEFHISSKAYRDSWAIGMVFLAPVYFLANIPKQFDYDAAACDFPKGVHFILKTILVPLSFVYMVILYAYLFKIIIQGELPQGQLGIMISIFAVIGIITHLAIYPLHNRSGKLINWFYNYFYAMLIVPLGLLLVAINERISQYGITEPRYLLIACAVWFATLISLNLLKRQHFQLKHVTVSLALLSIFISFGPWGINQLPVSNQFSRLEILLTKAGLLKKGQLQAGEHTTPELEKNISSIVSFLANHHAEDRLRPWFTNKEDFDQIQHDCNSKEFAGNCPSTAQQIVQLMGLTYRHDWENTERDYLSIRLAHHYADRTLPIKGFDTLIHISWMSFTPDREPSLNNTDSKVILNKQGQLVIQVTDSSTIRFDLLKLPARFNQQKGHITIQADQTDKLQFSQSTDTVEAVLYIDEFELWQQNSTINNLTITGYILLKFKP